MSRAREVVVVSCMTAFAVGAHAVLAGTIPSYTMYASTFDPAGGFEYVRVIPGDVVLGHLDHALLSGFFRGTDYSKEYALDDSAMLVTVDTTSAAVTPIGQTSFRNWTHLSISLDPTANLAYALVAETPCTSTTLYAVDLTNALTTPVGFADGCLEADLIVPDGTYYAIDSATSALVDVNQGEIGALGFSVGDDATLYRLPGSTTIYLLATDQSVGVMNSYTVDPLTGTATLIGPFSNVADAYTGVAVGGPLPDNVFADGFDD